MFKIIAFTGKQGSGKTEAAKHAKETLEREFPNSEVHIVKFAGPIYDCMYSICNRLRVKFDKAVMRPVMQSLGTQMRSTYGVNFWADQVEHELKKRKAFSLRKDVFILIDDLRYDNEADMLAQLNSEIVEIIASREARASRITLVEETHSSELGVSDKYVTRLIDNNSSLLSFYVKVGNLIEETKAANNS